MLIVEILESTENHKNNNKNHNSETVTFWGIISWVQFQQTVMRVEQIKGEQRQRGGKDQIVLMYYLSRWNKRKLNVDLKE